MGHTMPVLVHCFFSHLDQTLYGFINGNDWLQAVACSVFSAVFELNRDVFEDRLGQVLAVISC